MQPCALRDALPSSSPPTSKDWSQHAIYERTNTWNNSKAHLGTYA